MSLIKRIRIFYRGLLIFVLFVMLVFTISLLFVHYPKYAYMIAYTMLGFSLIYLLGVQADDDIDRDEYE